MIEVRRKGFISFEGCEGVGKTTQIKLLEEYLKKNKIDYILTREPGGTIIGDAIRALLLKAEQEKMSAECEMLLFAAERAEHLQKLLLPALLSGKLVICDRYVDSSIAYQGFGRNLGMDLVKASNSFAIETCMPEATIFIDMDPRVSWRKINGKNTETDRIEAESEVFHQRVYEGFCELARINKNRFISIKPDEDKKKTSEMIIKALQNKGIL